MPPSSPTACSFRYGSPALGWNVANSACSPRRGDRLVPVTVLQNAAAGSNTEAGRSTNAYSQRITVGSLSPVGREQRLRDLRAVVEDASARPPAPDQLGIEQDLEVAADRA